MRLREVELTNFKSFGEPSARVVLHPGVNVLSGPNGAGKSSVLEAVGLGLFQRTPDGTNLRDLGRMGGGAWKVAVRFEGSDRREYRLERDEKGSRLVDVDRDEEVASGVRAVGEHLSRALGIDRDLAPAELFRRILCCGQGDYTRDLELTAPARKLLFDPLFKVDRFKEMDSRLAPIAGAGRLVRMVTRPLEDQAQELRRRALPLEETESRREELEREMHEAMRRREETATELQQVRSALEALVDRQGELRRLHQEASLRGQARDAKAGQLEEARRRLEEAAESRLRREACQPAAERYQKVRRDLEELEPRKAKWIWVRAELRELEGDRERTLESLGSRVERREALRTRLAEDGARLSGMQDELARLGDQVEHIDEGTRREEGSVDSARSHLARARERLLSASQTLRELQAVEEEQEDRRRRHAALEERARLAAANPEEQGRLHQLSDGLQRLRHRHSKIQGQIELLEKERVLLTSGQCPFVSQECPGLSGWNLTDELERKLQDLNQRRFELDREIEEYESWQVKAQKAELTRSEGEAAEEKARELGEEIERVEARVRPRLEELTPARTAESLLEALTQLDRIDEESRPELRARIEKLRGPTTHSIGRAGAPLDDARELLEELEERTRDAAERRRRHRSELRDTREVTTRLDERVHGLRERIHEAERELTAEEAAIQELEEALARLDGELDLLREEAAPFRNLDEEESRLRDARADTEADYHEWLRLEAAALDEPARKERVETLEREERHLLEELEQLEERMSAATREAGSDEEVRQLERKRDSLTAEESRLAAETQSTLDQVERLGRELDEMRAARARAAELQADVDGYKQAASLISGLRRVFQNAAPRLAGRYLREVSREATRSYRSLAFREPAEVIWKEDYQVLLRGRFGGGEEVRQKEFPALSGGEQRAVALALRLALARVFSRADLLLLDEPTAHLDEAHRRRLASLLAGAVRDLGIDQLVVVTHDGSFDDVPHHAVRLEKEGGVSRISSAS